MKLYVVFAYFLDVACTALFWACSCVACEADFLLSSIILNMNTSLVPESWHGSGWEGPVEVI